MMANEATMATADSKSRVQVASGCDVAKDINERYEIHALDVIGSNLVVH